MVSSHLREVKMVTIRLSRNQITCRDWRRVDKQEPSNLAREKEGI